MSKSFLKGNRFEKSSDLNKRNRNTTVKIFVSKPIGENGKPNGENVILTVLKLCPINCPVIVLYWKNNNSTLGEMLSQNQKNVKALFILTEIYFLK